MAEKFRVLLVFGFIALAGMEMNKANARELDGLTKRQGGNCENVNAGHLCLALKYSVYTDSESKPVVSPKEALDNVTSINKVWSQCNLEFQLESYVKVDPSKDNLNYQPSNSYELDTIRKKLDDSNTMLVVTTGTWNRYGSLGSSPANAWTSMPGENLYGAILERPVGTFGNIIAHELGHYLNLYHVSDASDLMNPVIYQNSTLLSRDQCATARNTIERYWQKMIRT